MDDDFHLGHDDDQTIAMAMHSSPQQRSGGNDDDEFLRELTAEHETSTANQAASVLAALLSVPTDELPRSNIAEATTRAAAEAGGGGGAATTAGGPPSSAVASGAAMPTMADRLSALQMRPWPSRRRTLPAAFTGNGGAAALTGAAGVAGSQQQQQPNASAATASRAEPSQARGEQGAGEAAPPTQEEATTRNNKRKVAAPWTAEETEKFFLALSEFNTNFTLIAKKFPGRDRNDIKIKFMREQRKNYEKVDMYLKDTIPIDLDEFRRLSHESARTDMLKRSVKLDADQERILDELDEAPATQQAPSAGSKRPNDGDNNDDDEFAMSPAMTNRETSFLDDDDDADEDVPFAQRMKRFEAKQAGSSDPSEPPTKKAKTGKAEAKGKKPKSDRKKNDAPLEEFALDEPIVEEDAMVQAESMNHEASSGMGIPSESAPF